MTKKIKNLTNEEKVYGGYSVLASGEHDIFKDQELIFSSDDRLINDLTSIPAEASLIVSGIELFGSDAIKELLSTSVKVEEMPFSYPFAKKQLPDGKKLKRRKHGKRMTCPGNAETKITMAVPYVHCKIDEVEITQCSGNDDLDLKVVDTEAGTYTQMFTGTAVPNAVLDQFGFDIAMSDMYYSDSSNYDADLYQGMVIEVTYKNKESESKNIGVNFVLHEVI